MITRQFEQLSRDFRFALRRLLATPGFTAFAIISIALGLGVTTAAYSTIRALVWNASLIDDADHVAVVTQQVASANRPWFWAIAKSDFDLLRSNMQSVPAVAASTPISGVLDDGTETSVFGGKAVTGNYFSMAQLPVELGRGIQESDDRPDTDPVVVLSHEFWQSKTGGDPALVGRTVRIDDRAFVVIGVVAQSFQNGRDLNGQFGIANADAWIPLAKNTPAAKTQSAPATEPPLASSPAPATRQQPTSAAATSYEPELTVIARLPAGTTVEAVAAEVAGIGAGLDRSTPLAGGTAQTGPSKRSWSAVTASAIAREQAGIIVKAGGAIVLLVGLVLVVACTNIANLTLGRGASRKHEFSVRRALGASRGRLVREQCMESVMLAIVGGGAALLTAQIMIRLVTTDIPLFNGAVVAVRPKLNAPALIATGGSLLVSLVVFGLVPAIQLTRASLLERLAGDAVGAPASRWTGRGWLIACQVAISTAFMLIAFTSARAVTANTRQEPGFDLPHLAVASINFGSKHWDTARAQQAISALGAAAQTPTGFISVAFTMGLPLGEGRRVRQLARVSTADHELTPQSHEPIVRAMPSTPTIFRTLGVPILRGRAFDDHDIATTPLVIVISEDVARRIFGSTDVVGRRMRYLALPDDDTPRSVEVVGVARDTPSAVGDLKLGAVYVPLAQQDAQRVLVVGRTAGDPAPMVRVFSTMVRRADPELAVEFASTGPMVMTPSFVILRLAALLSGGLSILAVTLAMVGLYGVLSHAVGRRTREIGVRLALGAEAGRVRRMIIGEGLQPVVWGLGFGLLCGMGARLALRATDIAADISAIDPPALAVAAVTLLTAGVLASYLPAHRASKVDPNVALRTL